MMKFGEPKAPEAPVLPAAPVAEVEVGRKSASQWGNGEKYIGFLLGSKTATNRYGLMKIYTFATANEFGELTGQKLEVITSKDLEPQLALVKDRQAVQIECQGTVPGSKRVRFKVQTADNFLPE